MPELQTVPQYILDNVFNRIDYSIIHKGKQIKQFVHWVECKPTETPIGKVGGGYIVIYSNGDQHHMYEHPEDVFRDDKEAVSVEAKPMFVDDPNGPSTCTIDPEYLLNKP